MKKFIEKYCTSSNCFIVLLCIFISSFPFCFDSLDLLLDTTIQVKTGILMLDGVKITGDIYSWHEGLNWILHEKAWYLLAGFVYKYFQVPGLIIMSCISNLIIACIASFLAVYKLKASRTSVCISLILCFMYFNIPNNGIRPQVISVPTIVILCYVLSLCNNSLMKYICLIISTIIISLFHGSTIMLVIIVFAYYIFIDTLTNKNFKIVTINLAVLFLCISISFLIGGKETFNYLSNQSCYPEIMNEFLAWSPVSWTYKSIIVILLCFIGLSRFVVLTNKRDLLLIGYLSMFMVASSIYMRMIHYFGYVLLLLLPMSIDCIYKEIKLLIPKITKFLYLIKTKLVKSLFITNCITLIIVVFFNIFYADAFMCKTINDVAKTEAYDLELLNFIKENNYTKIYNEFLSGTWFAYNDIKVHLDDRVDPYLASYSGKDYYHNAKNINSIVHLDDFVNKYNPDAVIFYYNPDSDILYTNNGTESYEHSSKMCNFIYELDTFHSDRYKKVYENTVTAMSIYSFDGTESETNKKLTWVVYEPIYD